MKKIICVFVSCLSFFVFYLTFSMYSEAENQAFTSLVSKLEKDYSMKYNLYQIKLTKQISRDILELQDFADEHRMVLMTGIDQLTDLSGVTSWFLYDPNNTISFPTKNQKKISFSSDSNTYLTTNANDQDSYDIIDFVDVRNHKAYQDTRRIYTFSSYARVSENKRINLYVYSHEAKDKIDEIVQASNIAKYIEQPMELTSAAREETDYIVISQIIVVCIISICLLLYCLSIKYQKEILLRKLMGMSCRQISRGLFLRIMIEIVCWYIGVQVLCYIGFVRNIRPVTYPFIQILLSYVAGVVATLFVIYMILHLCVKKTTNLISLKKNIVSKQVVWLNLCMKFLVLLMIVPTLILFTKQGYTACSEFAFIVSHKEEMENQIYINAVNDRQTEGNDLVDIEKLIRDINVYMAKHGAVYQDFETYEDIKEFVKTHPEDTDFASIYPYIIVNDAYLNDYTLRNTNGENISIESITNETIFVPEHRELSDTDKGMYCESSDCETIYVKEGMTYWNLHVDTSLRTLKDPYVVYKPQIMLSFGAKSYHMVMDTDLKKKQFDSFIKTEGYDQLLSVKNTSSEYREMIEKYKDDILFLLPLFITYIFVILIFIYQSTYIYFIYKKQEFAIKYLTGSSYMERHGDMLLTNVMVYAPLCILLYFVFSVSWKEAVCCIIFAIVFELAGFYILIRRFEKNRLIEILKGE